MDTTIPEDTNTKKQNTKTKPLSSNKSDWTLYGIEIAKSLGALILLIILSSTFMYNLQDLTPDKLATLFVDKPYNINPNSYYESFIGFNIDKPDGPPDLLTMTAGAINKGIKAVGNFFGMINISKKVTSYVDPRYENAFTLANIYSWANANWLAKNFVNFINQKMLNQPNPNLQKILYNLVYYFSVTIFAFVAPVIGIMSVLGMLNGGLKNMYTKVPFYGVMYTLFIIIGIILSLVAFPFSIGLYLIIFQLASVFYYLYANKFVEQITLPTGSFKERFGYILEKAKPAHWAIVIFLLYNIFKAGSKSLSNKDQFFNIIGVGTALSLYTAYHIIRNLFSSSSTDNTTTDTQK